MANKIHSTAIIDNNVDLGDGNEIGPYSVIYGPVQIGNDNFIGPHVTIGTPGQDTRNPRYDSSSCKIEIGDRNIIREYTAIQKPCYRDITRVGNDVFLMQSVHVPHDAIIEDGVVITPMVVLAGIAMVLKGANLGIGCCVHQYTVVGQYSIVGMGAALTKNLKPFSKYVPGRPISVNYYALDKFGFGLYKDEIENYVLYDRKPESEAVKEVVEYFDRMAAASGRKVA